MNYPDKIYTYNDLPAYFRNDLEELNRNHPPDAPVAIVLLSEIDHNEAHYDPANYALITQIAKTHRVAFSIVSNIDSFLAAFNKVDKPILLFTNGHSRGLRIRVGQDLLTTDKAKELAKQIGPMMAENWTWVIKSCNAANSFAPEVAKEMQNPVYASTTKTSSIGTFFKDGQIHFFDNNWRETGVKFTGDMSEPSGISLCPESWLEERLAYLDRAERLNPAPEEINKIIKDRYRIGPYYYQLKQYDKAIPLIEPYARRETLEENQLEEIKAARILLGNIYYATGPNETAVHWYAKAIPDHDFFTIQSKAASLPQNPNLFFQISKLFIAQGKERCGEEWNYLAAKIGHFEALKKICAAIDLNSGYRKFEIPGYSKWFSLLLVNKSAPPDLDLPQVTDPELQMAIAKQLLDAKSGKATLWYQRAIANGHPPDVNFDEQVSVCSA